MYYLTALRWPRSSGGSFRSLTASVTADKRSTSFFSALGDLHDSEEADARLKLYAPPWPAAVTVKEEATTVDLRMIDNDATVRGSRVAMAQAQAQSNSQSKDLGLSLVSKCDWFTGQQGCEKICMSWSDMAIF